MLGYYLLHLEVLDQENSKHLEYFNFCMIYLMCFFTLLWSHLPQTTVFELCSVEQGKLWGSLPADFKASNSQHALARMFRLEMRKATLCNISARIHLGLIHSLGVIRKQETVTELSWEVIFLNKQKLQQEEKNYSSLHKFVLIFHPLSIGGKQMVSRC